MSMNQFQYPYGYPNQFTSMGYSQMQTPAYTQPLSIDTIRKMKAGGNKALNTQITEEERNVAVCTHKDPDRNNEFSLIENNDGSSTCYICGETFNLQQLTKEDVENVTSSMNDILQNIKTLYLDIPEKMATDFMMMIPLIRRIPQLYEIALANFNKYDIGLHTQSNVNSFGMLNAIMSPNTMMPGMGFGAPMGFPQQQFNPMVQQQPMMQQQSVYPGYNAFGYMGMPGGQPQQPQQGMQFPNQQNIQQQQQPVQPNVGQDGNKQQQHVVNNNSDASRPVTTKMFNV